MTRDEFLDWLSHAVELGLLTIGELRRQFDAGEFEANDLPLPLRDSIAGYQDDDNEVRTSGGSRHDFTVARGDIKYTTIVVLIRRTGFTLAGNVDGFTDHIFIPRVGNRAFGDSDL